MSDMRIAPPIEIFLIQTRRGTLVARVSYTLGGCPVVRRTAECADRQEVLGAIGQCLPIPKEKT